MRESNTSFQEAFKRFELFHPETQYTMKNDKLFLLQHTCNKFKRYKFQISSDVVYVFILKLFFSSPVHYDNDGESFIADWGLQRWKFQFRSCALLSSLHVNVFFSQFSRQYATKKHRSGWRSVKWKAYFATANRIDLIIRADAILFQSFSTFFSGLMVCVCLRNSSLKRTHISVLSVCMWSRFVLVGKSKPCFSLLYLPWQCVGCQLCILFFPASRAWKSKYSQAFWTLWEREKRKLSSYTLQWCVHKTRLKEKSS